MTYQYEHLLIVGTGDPHDALAPFGCEALLHRLELLRASAPADLGGVEVALGVDGDVVHPLELAGLAAVPTPLA